MIYSLAIRISLVTQNEIGWALNRSQGVEIPISALE